MANDKKKNDLREQLEEIFLAYDVRGPYPALLNETVMKQLGEVIAELLLSTEKSPEIMVGHDNRRSSFPLTRSLIKGLREAGVTTKLVGFIANGAMYHAAWKMKIPAAYITASHVAPPVNGLKLIRSDGTSFLEELRVIKELYVRNVESSGSANRSSFLGSSGLPSGTMTSLEGYGDLSGENIENISSQVKRHYIEFLMTILQEDRLSRKLNIVIDAMNGATTSILGELFDQVNIITPTFLRCPPPDQVPLDYGGIIPEPTAASANDLITEIKRRKADFGVMFDGDGDRALFVDDRGQPLDGTLITAIFAKFLLEEHPGGTVVVPVDATQALSDVVRRNGGRIKYVRIGHSFIEQSIKEEGVILCGESSHHYYFPKICPFSDGILSMLLLSHYLARLDETTRLSQMIAALPKYVLLRKNLHFNSHAEKNKSFEKFKAKILKNYDEHQILMIDGVKVHVDEHSWFLVRPSNTEPTIRIIIESREKETTMTLMEHVTRWIQGTIRS